MSTGRRAPRRMSPAQRREHLIDTALQLYRHHAPEDVSIEDIVAEADVSRALFYRYFSNVRDVHAAALSTVVDELIDRITLPADGDFRQQVHTALSDFVTFVETYASSYTTLLRSGSTIASSDTDTLIDRVRDHVVDLFAARLGLARPRPMLEMTIRGWIAVVETTLLSWLEGPVDTPPERAPEKTPVPRDQLEPWLVDQLLSMIAATARHDPATAGQVGSLLQ